MFISVQLFSFKGILEGKKHYLKCFLVSLISGVYILLRQGENDDK